MAKEGTRAVECCVAVRGLTRHSHSTPSGSSGNPRGGVLHGPAQRALQVTAADVETSVSERAAPGAGEGGLCLDWVGGMCTLQCCW